MFIALDEKNHRTSVDNIIENTNYFCPICGSPVSVKAQESSAIRPPFAHKRKCLDTWQHDMSEWHLNWQKCFPEENREVIVEKDGVKHRADVLVNGIVIEFQHSPIKADEIEERNSFYVSCGYNVVWVFDANEKISHCWGNNHSIDPFRCNVNDLQWKRKRAEFSKPMKSNVAIYLDYTTTISVPDIPADQPVPILLRLFENSEKRFTFVNTFPLYIGHNNFLKEYGCIANPDIYSVSDIIAKATEIQKKQRVQVNRMYSLKVIPGSRRRFRF